MNLRRLHAYRVLAVSVGCVFIMLACSGITRLGIQTDEALFAGGIFPPFSEQRSIKIGEDSYPLMVFDYVGSLKAFIYRPLLSIANVSAATVRIPMIILSAVSILFCAEIARRLLGVRAGILAAILLATDSNFLLTSRLDWGPVAIQIFCKSVAVYSFVVFWQTKKMGPWCGCFFLLGLGLWDKALFAWNVIGMAAACVVVGYPYIKEVVSWRKAVAASGAFVLGCLPLAIFNINNEYVTFRGNAGWSLEHISIKAQIMRMTLSGVGLGGFAVRESSDGQEAQPTSISEVVPVWLEKRGVYVSNSFLFHALVFSIIALWFIPMRHRQIATYFLVSTLCVWAMMLITKDAGGSVHHCVLVYPFPHLVVACVMDGLSAKGRRWKYAVCGCLVVIALSGISRTLQFYASEIRRGGTASWSDSIYGASKMLEARHISRVCMVDWGFYDNIRLLGKGRIALCTVGPVSTAADRMAIREELSNKATVYIMYVKGEEITPGSAERFVEYARSEGYEIADRRLFSDRTGRPVIETMQFARNEGETPRGSVH